MMSFNGSSTMQLVGVSDEHRRLLIEMGSRGVMHELGIELRYISPHRVVAALLISEKHLQPWGILHGGISITLAETVASLGGWLHCVLPDESAVGIEINANHLRSISSGTVVATAEPIHTGGTIQVWGVSIVSEDTGSPICASRCTILRRKKG